MEYVFICSNCKKTYAGSNQYTSTCCNDCQQSLIYTGITIERWQSLSQNDQEYFREVTINSWREKNKSEIETLSFSPPNDVSIAPSSTEIDYENLDPYLYDAACQVVEYEKASAGFLQRKFKIGFNRAARILDELYDIGVVGPEMGISPRVVIVKSLDNIDDIFDHLKTAAAIKKQSDEKNKVQERLNQESLWIKSVEETKYLIKDRFGTEIILNWAKSEVSSEIKENLLLKSASGNEQHNYLANLVINYSPEDLRLLVIGRLYATNGMSHMIIPTVSDKNKVQSAINWVNAEITDRLNTMVSFGIRSFTEIKDKTDKKMPYIIVVIEEIFDLLSDNAIHEELLKVLMLGKKCGIYVTAFSEFSERSLQLGAMRDIFKISDCMSYKMTHDYQKHSVHDSIVENVTIDEIDNRMNGLEFELFTSKMLEANGFHNINVTKSSGDYGADVTAYKDDIKYSIQCKKYSSPVGIDAVQEVIGSRSIYNCHVGVVLTNNYFTNAAIELAQNNLVILWDRSRLIEMIQNMG